MTTLHDRPGLTVPAVLLSALGLPERYIDPIIRAAVRRSFERALPWLPIVALPVLLIAAALPAILPTMLAPAEPAFPPVATPPVLPSASGLAADVLPSLGPRPIVFVLTLIVWAVFLQRAWPVLRLARDAVMAAWGTDLPPQARFTIAFRYDDPVTVPDGEIAEWADTALLGLELPLVRDGRITRPEDAAMASAIRVLLIQNGDPVTALDQGRVRLGATAVGVLAGEPAPARYTNADLWRARTIAYAMLAPTPSPQAMMFLDTSTLQAADPGLVRRDLAYLAEITNIRFHQPSIRFHPAAAASALRDYQPVLARKFRPEHSPNG